MDTRIVWKEGMAFEADLDGFTIAMDADPKVGGAGRGPKPKGLTLVSLGGCTAMDVISILLKMKQDVTGLEILVDSTLADDHPKKFETITVRYELTGRALDPGRVKRAVELSNTRYCGVNASLAPGVEIRSEIVINGELVG
jgi:putative redox protein